MRYGVFGGLKNDCRKWFMDRDGVGEGGDGFVKVMQSLEFFVAK